MILCGLRGLLVMGVMLIAAFASFAIGAQPTTTRTILVFGDSLSAGYDVPRDQAWANLLGERLKQQRIDYTVANASLSGETTIGGLSRIKATLVQHKPVIVLLALGANDGLRGQSIDTMRRNLEAIIAACRSANARVVLIGMRLPPNYGSAYASKFHETFLNIAREQKLPLVPFLMEGFADKRDWFQADGIHPSARAQPVMLDTVWKALQPLLSPQPIKKQTK